MSSRLFFANEVNLKLEGFVTNWNLNPNSKCGFLVYLWSYDLTVCDKSVLVTLMGVMQHDIKGIAEDRFLRLMNVYILLQ